MSNIIDWSVYMNNTWAWDWIGRVFPSSTDIRPTDLDGMVREGNWLLVLDGAVGRRPPHKPSTPWRITMCHHPQITYLAMLCPPDAFIDHTPTRITHYYLASGRWPAKAWQWDRWAPAPRYGRGDGLQPMTDLIAQWAAWAVEKTGRWEFIPDEAVS